MKTPSSRKRSLANFTASVIAAIGTLPLQDQTIRSQGVPQATCSSTWNTMTLVRLKVGLPWQILGSATMYSPSSTGLALWLIFLFMPLRENLPSRQLTGKNDLRRMR